MTNKECDGRHRRTVIITVYRIVLDLFIIPCERARLASSALRPNSLVNIDAPRQARDPRDTPGLECVSDTGLRLFSNYGAFAIEHVSSPLVVPYSFTLILRSCFFLGRQRRRISFLPDHRI